MANFLVLKILDSTSINLPSTQVYGSVEMRSATSDNPAEIEILKQSALLAQVDFNRYAFSARIATIVECNTASEAISESDDRFSLILDLKFSEFAISSMQTSAIGYVKNVDTGDIEPFVDPENQTSMMFVVAQGNTQTYDIVNYLLEQNNDLSNRFIKYLHWMRNSRHENNKQLKILFHCFALEALVNETESDKITSMARWFLGFPNGIRKPTISKAMISNLSNHPSYNYWEKEITSSLEKIRIMRNDSVHHGFRNSDFTKYDLNLFNHIMIFSTSRSLSYVRNALLKGCTTVAELRKHVADTFEENVDIGDVHNTIIHSLDAIKNKNTQGKAGH
ncbi:hypothetical protein M2401_001090 [Pseudomonas sp. JUb42]|uniref:HEPN domain-containing protein n=1 Tax=Pseudomonas sp. JUb42 TaxID=2940611 RepID=UPI002168B60A|nr:HEPN domain-containing protein [Pseudomonas sp. JUb42]MCS3467369.1 hypothetical protein [Pseudomonas sp. JUb42]